MVSIIVPIYNAEKYLNDCLDSLASQSFNDYEVILVNDGSTDSSKSICEDYCSRYSNFKLLNKENGGQMSAWILGVRFASSDFLGFVDSDDIVDKQFIEKMVSAQKEHNADLVMCSRKEITFSGDTIESSIPYHLKNYYCKEEMDAVRKMFLPTFEGNLSQARWDKLFRKDLYIQCMEKYCDVIVRTFEDRFIVIPYVFHSSSFTFIDEPLYYWRAVPYSSSRKPRPELCKIADDLFESHKKMIISLNIYETYLPLIELEKLDIIRNIFERNICVKARFKTLWYNSKLLMSKANREIVLKHKKDCRGSFAKFLYRSFKLKSKMLLIIGSRFYLRKNKNQK